MNNAADKYSPCSFHDMMIRQLNEKGLPEDMVTTIMTKVKTEMTEMRGRWDEKFTAYPETFLCVVWANVKAIARKYITDNAPCAWFAVLFEPGVEDIPREKIEEFIDDFRAKRNQQLSEGK